MASDQEKKKRTQLVLEALERRFGTEQRPDRDPVDVLVRGILSQNTSDTNSENAFDSLMEKFNTWDAVRSAPLHELKEAICCGGLAGRKARTIQGALSWLHGRGGYNMESLSSMPLEKAEKQLTSINGIGIKTARLVLLFAMGRPAFVVDTHVLRVCKRTGLLEESCSRIRAHHLMAALIPPEHTYSAHMNMIKLGRRLCRAKKPICSRCPVTAYCLHCHTC